MKLNTTPTAVLLDVGDTMAKANPSWRDVYATVFGAHGIDATADAFEAAFREAWRAWAHEGPFEATEEASFRRLMELDQLVFDRLGYPNLPESFFRDVDRAFRQRSAFHVFPDVIPALDAMQAAGLRLAVVSNWGWYAPELLQTLELARHFEVMSISARVGYQKPHHAIFTHALELLGIAPSEAIHVGDDPDADVIGARRAGIEPVLIDRRDRHDTPIGSRDRGRRRDHDRPSRGAAGPARHRAARGSRQDGRLKRPATSPAWRLFIAHPVPAVAREGLAAALATYRRQAPHVRWTRPESWHLTLLFLGSVAPDRVDALGALIESVASGCRPYRVRVDVGGGRSSRDGGVGWLALSHGADTLIKLAQGLADACPPMVGGPPPRRTPSAHLTLARKADRSTIDALRSQALGPLGVEWEVDRVELIRSHLGPDGARYETVRQVAL